MTLLSNAAADRPRVALRTLIQRTWLFWALPAISFLFLVFTGVAFLQSLLLVGFLVAQTASGAYWWRALTGREVGPLEDIGMGLGLGTAAALLAGLGSLLLPLGTPFRASPWALPAVATIVFWLLRRSRSLRVKPARKLELPELIALLSAGLLGTVSMAINVANYPLIWSGVWSKYHPDMYFFEALSKSSAVFGPSDSIFMAGNDIRYHWFTYAWAGQLTESSGAAPFVVMTRVLPLVALVGSIAIAIFWARHLSRISWVPTIAAVLIVSGGYVGATYGTILNFDSPSQALSTVWLLALSVVAIEALRRRVSWALAISVGLLIAVQSGGKISSAFVAVIALFLIALIAFVRKENYRNSAIVIAGFSGIAIVAIYVLVLAGSSEKGGLQLFHLLDKASSVQGLNPVNTPRGIIAGTLILGLAMIPRWAGLAWLAASRNSRWQPVTVYGLGLAFAGLATLLFVSGGLNDTWFALASSAPLSVISAVGLGAAVQLVAPSQAWLPRPMIIVTAVAGLLLAFGVAFIWTNGDGTSSLRWIGPLVGILGSLIIGFLFAHSNSLQGRVRARWLALVIVALVAMALPSRVLGIGSADFGVQATTGFDPAAFTPFTPFVNSDFQLPVTSVTSTQLESAQWLRTHASPQDVLATNVTASPVVPAFVGLRTYITGIHYQAPYGRPTQLAPLLAREVTSLSFINKPERDSAALLCQADVKWVWIDSTRTQARDWTPFAAIALRSQDVIILRMNAC